jgi:hypothetical protein
MARPEFVKLTVCHRDLFCRVVRNWMLHTQCRGNYKHLSVDAYVCISKLFRLTAVVVTEWWITRIPVWCVLRTVTLQGNSSQYSALCYSQTNKGWFLLSVSAGEFQLCTLCVRISRIHLLRVCMCIHVYYAPRSEEDSFYRSMCAICYERIWWVMFSGVPRGVWGVQPLPLPPKFQSFDITEPNSQFRGKYIRNNLLGIQVSLICKLSGTSD